MAKANEDAGVRLKWDLRLEHKKHEARAGHLGLAAGRRSNNAMARIVRATISSLGVMIEQTMPLLLRRPPPRASYRRRPVSMAEIGPGRRRGDETLRPSSSAEAGTKR